jgi:hypothetical protein
MRKAPKPIFVSEEKFRDAVLFLMRRSVGTLLTRKECRKFAECWRGPFYDGMTESVARQTVTLGFGWHIEQHLFSAIDPSARGSNASPGKCATTEGTTTMDMAQYVKKFMKLEDVKDGPLTMTIACVEMGKYGKPDLVFTTGEKLGLNLTNNLTLQRAYGTDSVGWAGKDVELYEGEVTYEGKQQAAVLITPISPPLTPEEKLAPVAAKAAAKPVGKDEADNSDMDDDIPFNR